METTGPGDVRALRAQLMLPEQRDLFDYWLSLKGERDLPRRGDISPAAMRRLLPHVSLIELHEDAEHARFRLAGSALRDIFGVELTNRTLADPCWGRHAEYWQRVCRQLWQERAPLFGMLRAPGAGREHLVLFWLRLPLSSNDGRGLMALGLDIARSARDSEKRGITEEADSFLLMQGGGLS